MPGNDPSPQTTLGILLGASEWPHSKLPGSPAFARSAYRVREYFLYSGHFGFRPENWLDLFDRKQSSPSEVDQAIETFLQERISFMKEAGTPASDLLFYYIGHGLFAFGPDQAYHLAIRNTNVERIRSSAIAMAALAETLKTNARHLRRFVILDCCFAAESLRYMMQSEPDQTALKQTISAFEEKSTGIGFPKKGTALLCSSGYKEASLILPDESGTMFSEAFVRALYQGNTRQWGKTYLSLYDLKTVIEEVLEKLAEGNAPRPFISSPDQSDGDVASVPFFPNPRAEEERLRRAEEAVRARKAKEEQARQAEEERLRKVEEERARVAEEERVKLAEEEQVRKAKAERTRLAEEEKERARLTEVEGLRKVEEEQERLRKAREEDQASQVKRPEPESELASVVPVLETTEANQPQQLGERAGLVIPSSRQLVSDVSATIPAQPDTKLPSSDRERLLQVGEERRQPERERAPQEQEQANKPEEERVREAKEEEHLLRIEEEQRRQVAEDEQAHIAEETQMPTAPANALATLKPAVPVPSPRDDALASTQPITSTPPPLTEMTSPVHGPSFPTEMVRTSTSLVGSTSDLSQSISAKRANKSWGTLLSLASVVVLTVVIFVSIAHQASVNTFNTNATATANGIATVHANATATANGIIATAHANATATRQASIPGYIWRTQNSGTSQTLQDVAWSGSRFVAVGDTGIILASLDGSTWTVQYQGGSKQHLYGIAWSGSRFVAVGWVEVPSNTDGLIVTSPNGLTWTVQTTVPAHILQSVAWLGSQFMAVGQAGIIVTSPDGLTWTAQKHFTYDAFLDVAWSGSRFVVVGDTILTSPDGSTWTFQDHPDAGQELDGVAWSGSRFMAVGTAGTFLTSPDGLTWTARNSDTPHLQPDPHRVAWLNSQFMVLANHGAISTSPDGHTWTVHSSGIDQGLYGVAWSGSRFVVVGGNGTILTSP